MTDEDGGREEHLFVIRMWREARAGGWRSTVDHVGSGRRLSSTDLDEVRDFIALRLPEDENRSERPSGEAKRIP